MRATRREERAGRTRGSQLVTFLNVPPSLASFSQSLPSEAIDAGPGRFGGTGVKAASPVVSSGKVALAFLTGCFSGFHVLGCQRGSAASPIGFLSTQREQM